MRLVLILLIVDMLRHYYKYMIPINCLFGTHLVGWPVCMAYCLVLFFPFRKRLSSEFWEEVPYLFNTAPFLLS